MGTLAEIFKDFDHDQVFEGEKREVIGLLEIEKAVGVTKKRVNELLEKKSKELTITFKKNQLNPGNRRMSQGRIYLSDGKNTDAYGLDGKLHFSLKDGDVKMAEKQKE